MWSPCYTLWARCLSVESLLHFVGAEAQCGVLATLCGRGGSVWSPCYTLWARWLSEESLLHFVGAVAQCGVLATFCGAVAQCGVLVTLCGAVALWFELRTFNPENSGWDPLAAVSKLGQFRLLHIATVHSTV